MTQTTETEEREEREELVLLQARVPLSLALAVAHLALDWGTYRNRAVAILLAAALSELDLSDPDNVRAKQN